MSKPLNWKSFGLPWMMITPQYFGLLFPIFQTLPNSLRMWIELLGTLGNNIRMI
jgi:hypothetical protein